MSKFKKKSNTSQDIPTSSLPDIIFMLLFFFMVSTVMRETDLLVENTLPQASQIVKLHQKSLVSHVYVGKPKETDKYGKEPRIQVNDALIEPKQVPQFIIEEKNKLGEDGAKITISMKADDEAKMGIVIDVKQQLREANALKLNYAARPKPIN